MEPNTCPGEAPIARSSANSRIRCCTDIAKVLEMMKAPTNREMPAKTSMNVCTKPSVSLMSAVASARMSVPPTVSTSVAPVVPTAAAMRSTSTCSLTPSSP